MFEQEYSVNGKKVRKFSGEQLNNTNKSYYFFEQIIIEIRIWRTFTIQ